MLAPDTVLQNRYRIVRQLGQGGMGTVYEAKALRLNTTIALKETHFTDERLRKQFEREAQLLAGLRHVALPRVIDHFDDGDGLYLVMDYIEGDDLWEMLQKQAGAFPVEAVLRWADQLLDALTYMHAQEPPIIHRDIKPQNLKLTSHGQIILLDFGLAKGFIGQISRVTTSGSIFGYTPNYSPLEQIQGTGTDARSDLYSLAGTLYHLMTGKVPPDVLTRLTATTDGEPDTLRPADEINRQVPKYVANVLTKAMAVGRSQRFANAAEMRDALKNVNSAAETIIAPFPTIIRTDSVITELQENNSLSEITRHMPPTLSPIVPDDSNSLTELATSQEETFVGGHQEKAVEFIGNDEAYLQWLSENPSGFVANSTKAKSPNYIVLHRAVCPHISKLESGLEGGFTERGYIKICSPQVESLREWVKEHGRTDGSFSSECNSCKPLASHSMANSIKQLQLEYWIALIETLRKNNSIVMLKEPRADYSITGFLGHPQTDLVAAANTKDGRIAVGVWIKGRKDIFRALQNERANIEGEIAWRNPNKKQDFLWLENENQTVSDIWLRWHGANIKERNRWQEYLEWHRKNLEAFYKTFEPRLRSYESQVNDAAPNYLRTSEAHPIPEGIERGDKPGAIAQIDEPVIAININQQYRHVESAEDLYNSTRSIWRLSRQRAQRARYAFAVYQGVIKEVYKIDRWMPARKETIEYWDKRSSAQGKYFPPEVNEGRSEFIGEVAPEAIREKYIGRQLPKRHSQNPILYFNC